MNGLLDDGRGAQILYAEDNDNDVELTRLGFKKAKLAVNLHHVRDGEECMAFLRKQGRWSCPARASMADRADCSCVSALQLAARLDNKQPPPAIQAHLRSKLIAGLMSTENAG
jgi:hypothetical protein